MPKSPFHVAAKSIDDHSLIAVTAISVGCCIDYAGNQISSAGAVICGIAKSDSAINKTFNVATNGTVAARVGASVALGDPLTSDASGRLIPATTGQPIFARAKEAASAADLYIEVFITREGKA